MFSSSFFEVMSVSYSFDATLARSCPSSLSIPVVDATAKNATAEDEGHAESCCCLSTFASSLSVTFRWSRCSAQRRSSCRTPQQLTGCLWGWQAWARARVELEIEACTEKLVAAGRHDLLIETVQREMREEMLTIVSEAKASKIRLSPLERARLQADAWLQLLETVRKLPMTNMRFQSDAAEYVMDCHSPPLGAKTLS